MPRIQDDNQLMLQILIIFAMVLYYDSARQPVARLAGRYDDAAFENQMLQHIIAFSLNGLGLDSRRLTA